MSASTAAWFSDTAAGYAATMAPSLRPIAAEVIRRARLASREHVLDLGTGTGTAAGMAHGADRSVVAIDAAQGMLDIARATVEGVTFEQMDFADLRFDDERFDVVLAVHALLFADDQVAALREWRRVTRTGGRLSLSVPGPDAVTPPALYGPVYRRHGIEVSRHYPTAASLMDLAESAGWADVRTDEDATTAIQLDDAAAFGVWRATGSRAVATADFTPAQHEALTADMLAVTPRDAAGRLTIPFGTIYLDAVAPS